MWDIIRNQEIRALIMALLAGLSTLLGALFVFFAKGDKERMVSVSLGFAAGIMISVSFTDLLPGATTSLSLAVGEKGGIILSVLFLLVGVLIAASIDRFVPHQEFDENSGEAKHQNLFRVGFVSMLAIGLHNFPEGIATFMAGYQDPQLGASIALAIALHNIPEGISVAMPVYFATGSKGKAFKYTFLSGISEPIGALLAYLVLRPFINDLVLGAIFGVVTGIMLHVSFEELIPSSRQYGYTKLALTATFAGICLMPLTHIL